MPFCSSCGYRVDENAAYCTSCGNKILTQSPAPPPVPGPPSWVPYYPAGPSFGDADRHALNKLKIYAIIVLAALIVSFASFFRSSSLLPFFRLPTNITSTAATPSTTPLTSQMFSGILLLLVIIFIISLIVEIAAILQLRFAFKGLAQVDSPHFGTPSTLTLVLLVCLPILFFGVVVELLGLETFLANFNPRQPPTATTISFPWTLLAGSGAALFAGIGTLVGFIGGVTLGVWRMGSRYNETLFKVASILLIIPLVQIVSPILMLIGVRATREKYTDLMRSTQK
ncbi:MAG: DUF973 family protein [Nitrososphaerales archaeon]